MGATSDKLQGQAKQVAGIVSGDKDLEAEGKADRQAGEAQEKVDEVKDKIADFVKDVTDKVQEVGDKATDKLRGK